MAESKSRESGHPLPHDGRSYPQWRMLALIMIGYTVYNVDKNILGVLIEPIKAEFHISDATAGALSGLAMIVPFVLAAIPIGMLADRMSRKVVLAVLLAGWSVSIGLGGFATSLFLLFVARMGVGLFESGFNPISLSLLNDIFPREKRSTAMGIYALGAPVGMFVALALGGVVAHEWGWRAAFLFAAVPGLIMAVVFLVFLVEPKSAKGGDNATVSPARLPAILSALWNNAPLLHTGVAMAYCTVVLANLAIWSPSFLVRIFGLGTHQAGFYSAVVVGVCGAFGAVGAGWLADRRARAGEWRRLNVVLFGIVMCVVCGFGAFVFATALPLVLVLLGLTAFFGQFYIGIGNSVIATHAPDADRAGTLAVLTIGYNILAYGLGPSLVGVISDVLAPFTGTRSIGWGLAATLLFSLVGAVHFLRARAVLRGEDPAPPPASALQSASGPLT